MAKDRPDGPKDEQIESLRKKLERFSNELDPGERELFSGLIDRDVLQALSQGRFDVQRMRDDDVGFWAQWSQRQY